jgi:hypothetical protein
MSDINLTEGIKGDMHGGGDSSAGGALLANSLPDQIMPDMKHIANKETLSGFYNTHTLVKGTFPWTTSDPVGKILFSFANHPMECNWLVDYVQKLFVGWAGHMNIDVRILGTAFMGGSLAFVLVPPTYTRAQALAMSREDVSVFDYVEVDPKDISTMNFAMKDFRPEHFHYEQYNDTNPRSFGGWIICMVWGKLNISPNVDGASLDILVRTQGSYTFRQPRPLQIGGVSVDTSFPNFTSTPLHEQLGCDNTLKTSVTELYQAPIAWTEVTNGFMYALNPTKLNQTGIQKYVKPAEPGFLNKIQANHPEGFESYIRQIQVTDTRPRRSWFFQRHGVQELDSLNMIAPIADSPNSFLNLTLRARSDGVFIANYNPADPIPVTYTLVSLPVSGGPGTDNWDMNPSGNDFLLRFLRSNAKEIPSASFWAPLGDSDQPRTFFPLASLPDSVIIKQRTDEQIVFFSSDNFATMSAQSLQFQDDLKGFQWPSGSSAIFSLNDEEGTIVSYVRISSSGLMSSRTGFTAPGTINFRFVQWLGDSSAMPTNPILSRYEFERQQDELTNMRAELKSIKKFLRSNPTK